jgi:hypothetical protein
MAGYIYNSACNCSRCSALRQRIPELRLNERDDGERVDHPFTLHPPTRNASAVVTPDYAGPPTLNELLDEEGSDESGAGMRGPKARRRGHAHDEGESPMEGNYDIVGGDRFESERYGNAPRMMTPDDILDMTGIGERHLSDVLDDLDEAYGADESEAVQRDNRRRLGLVRPKPNRLRGQVVQNVQHTNQGVAALPDAVRRELAAAGVALLGPGAMVTNVAQAYGPVAATYVPQGLHDLLASEDGPTPTVNAASDADNFGFPQGCIEQLVAEGKRQHGRYRNVR